MIELAAFLRARWDELEKRAAQFHHEDCWSCSPDRYPLDSTCTCGYPAQLLRDVEAKRRILDAAVVAWNQSCGPEETFWVGVAPTLRTVVANLAAAWCDHADYRGE